MMRTSLTIAAVCFLLAGCSGETEEAGDTGEVTVKEGAATPEDVFNQAKAAVEAGDWQAMFRLVDPQERNQFLAGLAMFSGFLAFGEPEDKAKKIKEEFEAIEKKHGVQELKEKPDAGDREAMKKAADDMFGAVKDKGALFSDIMGFVKKYGDQKNPIQKQMKGATLKEVSIDGTTAHGTITDAEGTDNHAHFVQRDGMWYMSMEGGGH